MTFPYVSDDTGVHPLSPHAIALGVASANMGTPVLMVSTVNSINTTAISANQSLSAVLLAGTSNVGFVSAMQSDAGQLLVSAHNSDAGLLRVSTIGGGASTSNDILVDGVDNTISARILQVSAAISSNMNGLVVNAQNRDSATNFRVSAFAAGTGFLSANQQISAVLLGGTANIGDVSALVSNSLSATANNFSVSAVAGDAGTFRVSAILAAGVSSSGAANFGVSAAQIDAGVLHTSAFVDSGSVSARSGDANQVHVSATQLDAGLLLTSAKQGDASLLRTSSFQSVVTTNTGAASIYFTSSGATSQVSTVKSTAGRLYGYHLGNPAGVDQYLQVFNTSGGATAGTDTPALTLYVPTLGGATNAVAGGIGAAFSNGIQIIGTSTANGQTIGASAMRVNLFYA